MELMKNLVPLDEQFDQKSEAWHTWRSRGIGATDAAAIAGLSKWSTALKVYNKKLGIEPASEDNNLNLELGNVLEPWLVDKFMENHNDTCTDCLRGRLFADGWKHCSLDAECLWHTRTDAGDSVEPVIIECKTASSADDWVPVPMGYYAQVQWQMGITGARKAFFSVVVLGPNKEYFEREVDFDPEFYDGLVKTCTEFWNDMENHVPPKPGHVLADVDSKAMNQIAFETEEDGTDVELTEAEVDKFKVLKERLEEAERAFGAYKNDLQYKVINGGSLKFNGKKFAYYVTRSGAVTIDKNKLKAQFPDAFEACSKMSTGCRYITFAGKV